MDPLSTVASIIAVLQAAACVISICYDIRAARRQPPKSLVRVVQEVRGVRDVIETIQVLLDDTAESSSLLKSGQWVGHLASTLANILSELQDLESKIQPLTFPASTPSRRQAVLSVLGWRLKEFDAQKAIQRLHNYKTTLSLALSVAESTILLEVRNAASALQKATETANAHIQVLYDKTMSQYQRDIVDWLSPLCSAESHEYARSAHQAGTSGWFIASDEFGRWINGDSSFLWVSGAPGAGKTVLFSHVADYVANNCSTQTSDHVSAFVYCDFRKSEGQRPKDVLGALLAQICCNLGVVPQGLVEAYDRSKRGGRKRRPEMDALQDQIKALSQGVQIYLLVDAVDEIVESAELAELLLGMAGSDGRIKVLVTSRNDVQLQQVLGRACHISLEDHANVVDQDINTYIGSRLQSDRLLQWLSSDVQNHILKALSSRSTGMFRWVQCQLDNISTLRTVHAVNMALGTLPQGLYETYDRILESVSTQEAECLRGILQWVAFAVLPLRLEDLHEATCIAADDDEEEQGSDVRYALLDPQEILSLGGALICVTSDGHVRLAHLSVRDYLVSSHIQTSRDLRKYALDPDESHACLAAACLAFLSSSCFADGPRNSAEEYLLRIKRHPLLRYAPMAWPYHMRAAYSIKTTSSYRRIQDMAIRFFSPETKEQFMSWVQTINADFDFKWNIYPRHATPLYYASSFGLSDLVLTLVLNSKTRLNAPGSRFGGTALHAATLRQHVPVMRALLDAGADLNKADFNGVTPLHTAVTHANVEVVKLLLGRGANADAMDSMGETPRTWAARAGQNEMLRLLEGGTGSDGSREDSSEPKSPEPLVWRRTLPYFPDFYAKRSGMESSIIVKVEIGHRKLDASMESRCTDESHTVTGNCHYSGTCALQD